MKTKTYYLFYRSKNEKSFSEKFTNHNKDEILKIGFSLKKEHGGGFYVLDNHGIVIKDCA
jgi:hypothetical protein